MVSQPVIALSAVRRSFGAAVAVEDLSLSIATGEMFGFIGPDGAGKTTTLRLICGLLKPDVGSIRIFGQDPHRVRDVATRSIGYLSQRFSLYSDLSIDENIEFFARVHGNPRFQERRSRLLNLTGLTPFRQRLAGRLSGGMKQKLALACTLVHEPRLLVLDEPTTGVDPVARREFWKLLAEFRAAGLTVVMATPYLDEAERCSRVALLNDGRLLALDEPAALQAETSGVVLEIVAQPVRTALQCVREHLGAEQAQLFGDRLHVRVDTRVDGVAVTRVLEQQAIEVTSVRPITPTLEDVFIERLVAAGAMGRPVDNDEVGGR